MNTKQLSMRAKEVGFLSLSFVVATGANGFAQDVLGIAPVAAVVLTSLQAIALVVLGWVMLKLMGGRHTVEALVCCIVGGLAIAKIPAIAALLGIGGG